jgi:hypothetical protein
VTTELVDEAVNAWYGALKAFALLSPRVYSKRES